MGSAALALSGAGTKGAFEVGALRYLVAEHGYVPEIITATSAGAIAATVLAQARGRDELAGRVEELRADLLAMTATEVVFAKQPWLAAFDGTALGTAVDDFLTVRNRPAVPADPDGPGSGGPGAGPGVGPGGADAAAVGEEPPVARRRHRRWHDLAEVLRELPHLQRARTELPGHATSLLTLDPLEAALRGSGGSGIGAVDPALVARPGLTVRLSVTALGAGCTRYVTETGALVEADARTPVASVAPGEIDVIDGLLTSSSVPMIFPPRPIGDDVYVDGGVRQNIPVGAAVALGADQVVAVLGVALEPPPAAPGAATGNLVGIHLRASNLMFFETQLGNLAAARAAGVALTVIAPTLDVVGPFEVAQGLMLLDMDYGWLRAADVLGELDAAAGGRAAELSDAATAARERAWYLEEDLWTSSPSSPSAPAAADALDRLRREKRRVHAAVEQRRQLGAATPSGADAWWLGWEHHGTDRPDHLPEDPWAPVGGFTAD